jgi:hypothetical protein
MPGPLPEFDGWECAEMWRREEKYCFDRTW